MHHTNSYIFTGDAYTPPTLFFVLQLVFVDPILTKYTKIVIYCLLGSKTRHGAHQYARCWNCSQVHLNDDLVLLKSGFRFSTYASLFTNCTNAQKDSIILLWICFQQFQKLCLHLRRGIQVHCVLQVVECECEFTV